MTIASKKQIDELQKRIKKLQERNTGLNEKEACKIMRTAVRKCWMRHPVKLLAIDLNTIADTDPSTRTIWKVKCDRCGKFFSKNEIEVDHIKGEHSLKKLDDLVPFVLSILDVTTKDLQILDKACHRIKTMSERYGYSEVDAEIRINAKDWIDSTKVEKQKITFDKLGCSEKDYSNAKKRMELAVKFKLK